MKREVGKKVRSDKKIDVKPTLSIRLKDLIYSISYVTHTPVKSVGESLSLFALHSKDMMESLAPYLKRTVRIANTLYRGHDDNPQLVKKVFGKNEKITIRFKQQDYARLYDLAYALGVSPSRVVAVLIELALSDVKPFEWYVNETVDGMTDNQLKEYERIKKQLR